MELSSLPCVDKKMRTKHVSDIKKDVEVKNKKIELGICPRCNGVLIERNGPYGRFWGCSNFPRCKFVQKI
jgi:ssDNA-binding Zn-finger/Zn-ribbon topoisomerase 1